MLPATVAPSFAFLLPPATPANVIVLAKSQDLIRPLRFRDFIGSGLPLTVAVVFVGALLSHVMGRLVFDSDAPFPAWACTASGASCLFVDIPGVVQGRDVQAQACIVDLGASDGTLCQLWNGTMVSTLQFVRGR
mmetsp:Transcript_5338/g.17386  ORF Transcript_5338/g.17386 Transcript_5338/m.17386 type:complete len:134 (+) Transcript_5338:3-404(+)